MILDRIDHALMPSVIGPENLCHPFDRSDAKLNQSPLATSAFPRLKDVVCLYSVSFYFPLVVSPLTMIGLLWCVPLL